MTRRRLVLGAALGVLLVTPAIKAFQRSQDLPDSGTLDAATIDRLGVTLAADDRRQLAAATSRRRP